MLTLMPMAADAEVTSDAAKWIEKFTGGKEAVKGKISLDLPEIAENGNTVPLSLTIESPMTAESHVKEVHDPRRREPERRRRDADVHAALGQGGSLDPHWLATTQNVVAIAKMSDGAVFTEQKTVKVTIGGCGG